MRHTCPKAEHGSEVEKAGPENGLKWREHSRRNDRRDGIGRIVKSVDEITGIHRAQLLTYLKLTGIPTGLLINFNVARLIDGLERFKL